MTKNDDLNFEEKGDYSIGLMDEILSDIVNLSKYSSSQVEGSLDDVNKKIDLARTYGLNVEELDNQVRDFRIILFNRDIENKLEELEGDFNYLSLDIEKIEKEYSELKKERGINIESLDLKMKELYAKITISKIKLMINNIKDSSNGDFDADYIKIADEIEKAEEKGINVDEIKDIIYG